MLSVEIARRQGAFGLDAAFTIEAQGITGLVGPSGSGKSTLFACLAGLARPDSGTVGFRGRTLFDADRGIDVPTARRRIGLVFQEGVLFPHLSVRGNLTYGAAPATAGLFDELVETLDLAALLQRRPGRLSGGERQRVSLGRALLAQPRLLLLDEPVSALDPAMRAQVLALIARVQARTGTPMLYISHAPEEIRQLAHRVITLDRGRVAAVSDAPGPVRASLEKAHQPLARVG